MNMTITPMKPIAVSTASLASISRVALMMDTNSAAGNAMLSTTLLSPCRWSSSK